MVAAEQNYQHLILSLKKSLAFPPGIAWRAANGKGPEISSPQQEINHHKESRSTSEKGKKDIANRLGKEQKRNVVKREDRELWSGDCGTGCCTCTDPPGCSAECATAVGPIGQGSCNGDEACFNARSEVGSSSCNGVRACYTVMGAVSSLSCNGDYACFIAKGPFAFNSCIGAYACWKAQGAVGINSCIGLDACYNSQGAVGINSCIGENACGRLPLPVGSGSCNGLDACRCDDPKGDGTAVGDGECNRRGGWLYRC